MTPVRTITIAAAAASAVLLAAYLSSHVISLHAATWLAVAAATAIVAALSHRWTSWIALLIRSGVDQSREARALALLAPMVRGHLPHSNWSLTPDALVEVLNHVHFKRPRLVVEIGSGVSTVLLASLFRQSGVGHVYALEHDPAWAAYVRTLLAEQGLESFATIVEASLVERPLGQRTVRWFAEDAIAPVTALSDVSVVLVDGPPSRPGELSRYPAVPFLWQTLSDDAVIFLDDSRRDGESETVRLWARQYGLLTTQYEVTRGLAALRRHPGSRAPDGSPE